MESGPEEALKVQLMATAEAAEAAAASPRGSSTESLSVCFFTTQSIKKNDRRGE